MSVLRDAERLPIDASVVGRRFAHPRVVAADDFLQREVARRLLERLVSVRVDATRVVDLGCGAGADLEALRARFVGATVIGIDLVQRSATPGKADRRPSALARLIRRETRPLRVGADFAALPFAAKSVDVLWSNLGLHWSAAPHRVLPEWNRVTRVGGLVAFSAFGPDTLREVVDAFARVDGEPHVMPFIDMHDYGDMLVASGFATPVVDMERLTLTYTSLDSLWRDVRALGGNALLDRRRALRGRDWGSRLAEAFPRDADGRCRLTFELVYAHAWKGEPRTTSRGETIVRVERPR